jgi:hypothetical protein
MRVICRLPLIVPAMLGLAACEPSPPAATTQIIVQQPAGTIVPAAPMPPPPPVSELVLRRPRVRPRRSGSPGTGATVGSAAIRGAGRLGNMLPSRRERRPGSLASGSSRAAAGCGARAIGPERRLSNQANSQTGSLILARNAA